MSTQNVCLWWRNKFIPEITKYSSITSPLKDPSQVFFCFFFYRNTIRSKKEKQMFYLHPFFLSWVVRYRILPNYCTYPYKRTVKQFYSLLITASVLFVYFFIKAYVVGTHLNCIHLWMQFKWVPTTYIVCFNKETQKKKKNRINITK